MTAHCAEIDYKSKDWPWALGLLGFVRPNNYIYFIFYLIFFLRGRFAQEGCLRDPLVVRKPVEKFHKLLGERVSCSSSSER